MEKDLSRWALVISTEADRATKYVSRSVDITRVVFTSHNYELIDFEGKRANAANVYSELVGHSGLNRYVNVGFVVAHGSDHYLYGNDDEPIFDKKTAELLRGTILVLNSCLVSGKLPRYFTSLPRLAKAIIGYAPRLRTTLPKNIKDTIVCLVRDVLSVQELHDDFSEAIVTPIRELVENGKSVNQAVDQTRLQWEKMHEKYVESNPFIANPLQLNMKAVRYWGNPNAKLSHLDSKKQELMD